MTISMSQMKVHVNRQERDNSAAEQRNTTMCDVQQGLSSICRTRDKDNGDECSSPR